MRRCNACWGSVTQVGVEDKTNKLIGFDRRNADNERNYFNNQANEHLTPRPAMKISFVRYEINGNERFIIKVIVEESAVKPVILKYKNIPSIFMRRDGFTNGATYEEIIEMSVKSKNTQYDILVSDVKYNWDKLLSLRAFYEKHNEGATLKEKALQSLGFVNEEGYLLNGAALFLDDYKERKTEVQCSVFSGFNKGSERIVTINKFNGNITSTIEYIMDFVKQRMNHSMIKLDDERINIDSYPARALFEGVINAVAHRDYYLDGTQIQVDIFKDRLEISSPGGFYRGEKLGKTYDLSGVISKRRNELIAGVLVAKILVTDASRERVPGTKHLMTESMDEVLAEDGLQVVFEAIVNEEPAFSYLKRAVDAKCHVITANKVMLAKRGKELEALAKANGVFVGYEASVAGGVPIIKTMKNILLVNDVNRVQGILNGTTNYILTKMRAEGWSFDQALKEAQRLGYAEADPFNDISGQDAFLFSYGNRLAKSSLFRAYSGFFWEKYAARNLFRFIY